ncbi:TonB-dependent receptor [Sphingomonas sp. Leaf412]|uniref:TonB-dependent receptor n=1 Tax=Sphingomonas sp. Leaf412 TaxID=1736370 RepID=UPI0006F6896A|nr:TonB-dependent receptor [Sphingomonas sp. Leaf412]KQT31776.1 TonB-dependent receptor [Sphingomonas sp. Leaf412]
MRNSLFLGAAAIAMIAPAAAMAQETTSTIRGNVTSGDAPAAGARVVATHVPSGTVTETTADANGVYTLNGLRAGGPFTVEVTAAEGNTQVTDIFTVVGQPYTLPIDLATASGGSDIVVTAGSIQGAGVTSDGPQTVLTARDIAKVASVNRDVRDLARRDPFANLDASNSRAVSFAGTNPRFNRFTINGVQVGDNFGLNSDSNPTGRGPIPFDAIEQFSVSIAPFDIRQGNFQGGAINTTMKSGTNNFQGTGFYSTSTDEMQGKRLRSLDISSSLPSYNSETYGATLSGPIVADKLFFMVSAERNTDPRPFTPSGIAQVPGLTQGTLDTITGIAQSRYGYDAGTILPLNNQVDEKIVGKIDWNITTGQRLSLSYINAYESADVLQNTAVNNAATPQIGLSSNAYSRSVLLRAGIVQLNSDWTDRLSTEVRGLYKWNRVGQDALGNRNFAQFRVCAAPTSIIAASGSDTATGCGTGVPVVSFGPDISRQANQLFFDTWGGSALAKYSAEGHDIRALVEVNQNRTFNLFQQNVTGNYYFDSIADFRAGNASGANIAIPLTGDINTVAADFRYTQFTFGLEDAWQVTDTLRVTSGVRYDLYSMGDTIPFNPFFQARTGFRNTKTFKGLDNFQPRISFEWTPDNALRVRGGVGIFGGGSPDVYLSNSFSTTGVLANAFASGGTLGVTRATAAGTATATCAGSSFNANGVCTGFLNNVTGTSVPAVVTNYLANNTGSLATAGTAALDPDLRLPSNMKATISADYKLFGLNIGGDFLYTKTLNAPSFTDARSIVIGTLPDGRPRYNASTLYNGQVTTSAGVPIVNGVGSDGNSDIIFFNERRGRSFVAVARASKDFDFGLDLGASFTWQDVKDVSPATSSTAGSLYGNAAMSNPNLPAYGISADQIRWMVKYNVGFDRAFFGDYRTVMQLFGETRAGRPYSYTMRNNVQGRSPVFGTISNNDRYLLYVPTSTTDPLVTYDTTATRDSLESFINGSELSKYRGKIAPKNIGRNPVYTKIDLHLEQEIPTFVGGSRLALFADIENLPNLLNKNWGGLRQFGFPQTGRVVDVTCLTTAGNAIGAGTAANAPTQPCAQYRYSVYNEPNERAVVNNGSFYFIRVGARFSF